MLASLRKTVMNVALASCAAQRHTERGDRVGGGLVRKGALGMSRRGQELTVSPEAQEDSGAPSSFPLLNQELEHSSRGPRGAQQREQKGKDCALRGPGRTVRSNG